MLLDGLSDRTRIDVDAEALRILRDELPNIDVMISSQYSPQLADAIVKGTVGAGFFDANKACQSWRSVLLVKEPLVVVLPSDHRLAKRKAISPGDLVGETFVGVSHTAPVLRAIIDDYLRQSGDNHPVGNGVVFHQATGHQRGRGDDTHSFLRVIGAVAEAVSGGGKELQACGTTCPRDGGVAAGQSMWL